MREMKLGCLLNKASHLMKWNINEGLKSYQLTSAQWAVLMDLFMQEKKQNSIENNAPALIAERLQVERPAITRIIDRLIEEGWVNRLKHPSDRRSQLISLTPRAKEAIPEIEQVIKGITRHTMAGFSEEEIIELEQFITKIINNLDSNRPTAD